MSGELSSERSGQFGSELDWLSSEGVLGAVLGVELLEGLGVGEGALQGGSLLVVDDGQASGDGLSDELELETAAMGWPSASSLSDIRDWRLKPARFD